jgi:hypothetical protein
MTYRSRSLGRKATSAGEDWSSDADENWETETEREFPLDRCGRTTGEASSGRGFLRTVDELVGNREASPDSPVPGRGGREVGEEERFL